MSAQYELGPPLLNRVLDLIKGIEDFRLIIYNDAYRLCIYRQKVSDWKNALEIDRKFVSLGFPRHIRSHCIYSPLDEPGVPKPDVENEDEFYLNTIKYFEREIETRSKQVEELRHRLDQYRSLGLHDYVDANVRAVELDLEARKSLVFCDMDIAEGRVDRVFVHLVDATHLLAQRVSVFPLWFVLESKRCKMTNEFLNLYKRRDSESSVTLLLEWFQTLADFSLQRRHVRQMCSKYKFHCRFLNDEFRNITRFVLDLCPHALFEVVRYNICFDEVGISDKLCRVCLDDGCQVSEYLRLHSLRLYRACMRKEKTSLAAEWLHVRFDEDYSDEKACSLAKETILCLGSNKKDFRRLELNGRFKGARSGHGYRLPSLKTQPVRTQSKPWWVNKLRTSTMTHHARVPMGGSTVDSAASTVGPPEGATTLTPQERGELLLQESLDANKTAAKFYRTRDEMSDLEMSSVPFSFVRVEVKNRLVIKWKDSRGEERERRTNMSVGGLYHCRSFSYDALRNEWEGKDNYCKIVELMSMGLKGGSREAIRVQDGSSTLPISNSTLFKTYRDFWDHRLDNYLADIRAQSVASYYVERFREVTQDQFGVLVMIHSELFLLYDSAERRTIIEYLTRERYVMKPDHTQNDFQKYTNNWDYKNRSVDTSIFEAFSHFSYHDSEGVLMVTDIQGFSGEYGYSDQLLFCLTDPVIHCQTRAPSLFGRTNHGTEGMKQFFVTVHPECNEICNFLGLKRPDSLL